MKTHMKVEYLAGLGPKRFSGHYVVMPKQSGGRILVAGPFPNKDAANTKLQELRGTKQ